MIIMKLLVMAMVNYLISHRIICRSCTGIARCCLSLLGSSVLCDGTQVLIELVDMVQGCY